MFIEDTYCKSIFFLHHVKDHIILSIILNDYIVVLKFCKSQNWGFDMDIERLGPSDVFKTHFE